MRRRRNPPTLAPMPYLTLALAIVATGFGILLWRWFDEARAVERALVHEVAAMRCQAASMAAEIARRYKAAEPFDEDFFALWRLSAPLVYPAAGAAIGRLPREALDRVGYFHAQIADARARLADARESGDFTPSPYRMLSCLLRACNHVEPWLRKLQPQPNPLSWQFPDTTEADRLLEAMEQAAQEPIAVAYCWVDCALPPDA